MNETSKFARYRARKKARGLRELRMWVPDINAPGFQAQLDRAVTAIDASDEEAEILRWCEAAAAEAWNSEDLRQPCISPR